MIPLDYADPLCGKYLTVLRSRYQRTSRNYKRYNLIAVACHDHAGDARHVNADVNVLPSHEYVHACVSRHRLDANAGDADPCVSARACE